MNDFVGSNEIQAKHLPVIRKLKDYFFATLAFPLAFNVGGMFWLLMTIDRDLVMPEAVDAFFPSWLNQIEHSYIMVFIVVEMILVYRKYPSQKSCLTGLTVFMAVYLAWVHVIKYNTDKWVYPILNVLPFYQRILFFAFCLSVPVSFYFLGNFLNNIIWSKSRITSKNVKKDKKKK